MPEFERRGVQDTARNMIVIACAARFFHWLFYEYAVDRTPFLVFYVRSVCLGPLLEATRTVKGSDPLSLAGCGFVVVH